MNEPIEFETPRLSLRQWRAADREPFAALNADPIVMAHFPAQLTREKSDALADRCDRLIAERGWGVWATQIKATGEFVSPVRLGLEEQPFARVIEDEVVEILSLRGEERCREGAPGLDLETAARTLGAVIKYREDSDRVKHALDRMLAR